MIITGTYLTSKLVDSSGTQHEFTLFPPRSMALPQYLWKLDYDLDSKTGIVYVALCNPYTPIDKIEHICETIPCPGFEQLSAETRKVVYCCSKEAFDYTYQGFDRLVYDKF